MAPKGKVKRTKRNAFKNRRFKRKNEQIYEHTLTVKGPGKGCPDIMRVPFRYVDRVNFALVANTMVIKASSLWDPNGILNKGHQPYFSDQWSYFYKNYLVEAVDLKIEIMNQNGNYGAWVSAGFTNTDPSTLTVGQLEDLPDSKRVMVGNASGTSIRYIHIYRTMKQIIGYKSTEQLVNYSGVLNVSDPPTMFYGYIMGLSADGIGLNNLDVRWELIQYSKLYNKQTPATSYQDGITGSTGPSFNIIPGAPTLL